MKVCTKCGVNKKDTEYYLHKKGGTKRATCCIDCEIINQRKKYYTEHCKKVRKALSERRLLKNPNYWKEKYAKYGRKRKLRDFGLTADDYNKMLKTQKGLCAICGQPETMLINCSNKEKRIRPLSIDHDHKTGETRGLLCNKCNQGIARFDENIEYFANAISYIEKHKKVGQFAGAIQNA